MISFYSFLAIVIVLMAAFAIKLGLTHRKRLETALHESEARYSSLFKGSHVVMLLIDPDTGDIVDANPAACDFCGYTHTEIIQLKITDINPSPPERLAQIMQDIKREGRKSHNFKYRLASGAVVEVEVHSGLVKWGDRDVLFSMVYDITERKRMEIALQESEALFRATFEEAPIGIGLTNMQGQLLSSNLAFQNMLGYSAAQLQQMTIAEITHPDDVDQSIKLHQALSGVEYPSYQLEKRYLRQDGEIVWGRLTASPIRDNQGRPLYHIGLIEDITRHRQTEEALHKLSHAVQQSASTIVITDAQGYIEYANPRFSQTTGYSIEEAIGQHTRLLKSGHTSPEEYQQLWQTITAGKEWRGEFYNKKKNGELYWETASISPIRNANGVITHFVAVKEDITGRKQFEEMLRQSEERYRHVVDSLKEVIFQIDAAGHWTFLNPAWTEITGFSVSQTLGTSCLDYIHPDDRAQNAEAMRALVHQEVDYCRQEFRLITKAGHLRWLEIYAQLTQTADGTILGLSGGLNDVTDRKRAEQALRASEIRFRTLTNHAPVGIFETSAQGDRIFVNKYWSDLTGLTPAEALGYGWTKALHPDDRESVLAAWQTAIEAKGEYAGEYRFQTGAGAVNWVFARAIPLRNEAEEFAGYLGTVTDITESKKLSEQLSQRAAQLMLINDISSQIAAVLELDSVFDRAAHLVHTTFGYHHVALFLLDNDVARLKAIAGSYTAYFPANHSQGLDRGIIGWVATHGEKLVANDVNQEPHYISQIADQTVARAELCLPVRVADQTVGVLDLQSPHLNAFGENDIILMETLVAQIAVAVENARLYQAIQVELAERKRIEASLRQSEERFALAIEGSNDGIWDHDLVNKRVYWSPRLFELFGYDPVEFVPTYKNFIDSLHPDDRDYFSAAGEAHFKDRVPYNLELRSRVKSGEYRWFRIGAQAVWDETDRPVRIVGSMTDITERKQMEEALRQSEERFALAVQGSNDGIWDHDLVNKSVYWSPRLFELYGYEPDEIVPTFEIFVAAVHPDDQDRFFATSEAHLKDRVPFDQELRSRVKSGEYRWFRIRAQAVWGETGRPVRLVGSTTDITERKRMEETLSEERNLLRTVINATPDWIFVKDRDHRFRLVNQSLADVYGYPPEDIIGKNDLDLGVPEEIVKGDPEKGIPGYWADDLEVMQSGQRKDIVEEYHVINDQSRVLSTVKIPLRDETTHSVAGVLAFIHDITDLKQTQAQLQQAKEAAEAATQVKSEFLANMSHEIRTPLNAVIGMTSLLMDTALSPEQRDFAETIRTSGDGLLTIINDILDFSKIEAGKLDLEKQPFDLRQCIEEAFDLIAIKAAEKKLDLAYLIDDLTPGAVVGDVTRLRQILVNLLTNAVKFTDQGEVVLEVTSQPYDADSKQAEQNSSPLQPVTSFLLHFSVRDTGLGIPPGRQDRLFHSFSQVDASTTRKYGGTGLGLTISSRLSEMMGGRLWLESTGVPGQGSTFHFTMLAQAAASQLTGLARGEQPELIGKRLLIVDDNATNRLILARQTQAWGMQPHPAASGAEALSWLGRGDSFDLAILDMHMPEMDGLMLAAQIRRLEQSQAKLPLVMLTSLGAWEVSDQAVEIEFAAFLTKPIKSSHLYDTLLNVVAGHRVKLQPDSTPSSLSGVTLGQTHPLHILLAEDNVVNQKVALQLLKRIGYSADIAANGLEVLQALKRQAYDVVLMDMQMPEMDGLEATRLILEQWPIERRPWIIAQTANALQGDRERCLQAGMNDYVSKPVRPEELKQALLRCRPDSGSGQAAAPVQMVEAAPAEVQAINDQMSSMEATFDDKVFAEMIELLGESGPQMVGEIVDLYLATAVSVLEEIRTAAQQKDGLALSRAAHTLKPSSAQLGALHLSAVCRELEAAGKSGQLEGVTAQVAELEAEFSRVRDALEAEKCRICTPQPVAGLLSG